MSGESAARGQVLGIFITGMTVTTYKSLLLIYLTTYLSHRRTFMSRMECRDPD